MKSVTHEDTARQYIDDATVQQFAKLFPGPRSYGWDPKTSKYVSGQPFTPKLSDYRKHLEGKKGLVLVPVDEKGQCNFGAIDIDDKDGTKNINPRQIEADIKRFRLPLVVCLSKSGTGSHLYCFFKKPVNARLLREKLQQWVKLLNLQKLCDRMFPGQDSLDDSLGSGINLPYHKGYDTGRFAIINGEPSKLDKFLEYAEQKSITPEELNENLDPKHTEAPPCIQRMLNGEAPRINPDDCQQMLRFIPPDIDNTPYQSSYDDYDHGVIGWLDVGMVLHNHFDGSDEALQVWDEWSQRDHARYDAEILRKKWNKFSTDKTNKKGIGTLIAIATTKGYQLSPGSSIDTSKNILHHFTVYTKKAFQSEDYRNVARKFNKDMLQLPEDKAGTVIESASRRKTYTYAKNGFCDGLKRLGLCDVETCMTRKHGIKEDEASQLEETKLKNLPLLGPLVQYNFDPPRYDIGIDGVMVEVGIFDVLVSPRKFKNAVGPKIKEVLKMPKEDAWIDEVNRLLKDVEEIEVSEDANSSGQIWGIFIEWLHRGDIHLLLDPEREPTKQDLVTLRRGIPAPYRHKGQLGMVFHLSDFITHLKRVRFLDKSADGDIARILMNKGVIGGVKVCPNGQQLKRWFYTISPEEIDSKDVPETEFPETEF